MRTSLALFGALILIFLCVGGSRDWYGVQSLPAMPGNHAFRVEIHTAKVGQDVVNGLRKLHQALSDHKSDSEAHSEKTD